jgi:hypothetical protein
VPSPELLAKKPGVGTEHPILVAYDDRVLMDTLPPTDPMVILANELKGQSQCQSSLLTHFLGPAVNVLNPAVSLTSGLNLWLKFDETTGLTASDSSGLIRAPRTPDTHSPFACKSA